MPDELAPDIWFLSCSEPLGRWPLDSPRDFCPLRAERTAQYMAETFLKSIVNLGHPVICILLPSCYSCFNSYSYRPPPTSNTCTATSWCRRLNVTNGLRTRSIGAPGLGKNVRTLVCHLASSVKRAWERQILSLCVPNALVDLNRRTALS